MPLYAGKYCAHFCKICKICCDRMIAINRYPYLVVASRRPSGATHSDGCWLLLLAARAKITMITDKAVTVRQSDGTDSRLFVSQLQLGKYTIRHAVWQLRRQWTFSRLIWFHHSALDDWWLAAYPWQSYVPRTNCQAGVLIGHITGVARPLIESHTGS